MKSFLFGLSAFSFAAHATDGYRHLEKSWQDLPDLRASGVKGSWEAYRRAERWSTYADWVEIEENWSRFAERARKGCSEAEKSTIDSTLAKLRAQREKFETLCLPEGSESGYLCRFEAERAALAREAFETLEKVVEACGEDADSNTPWRLKTDAKAAALYRTWSRDGRRKNVPVYEASAQALTSRHFGGWALRADLMGAYRHESVGRPRYRIEVAPSFRIGERQWIELGAFANENRGSYDLARAALRSDQRYGGFFGWSRRASGAPDPSEALDYRLTLRKTSEGAYDGTRHAASLLMGSRVRVGTRFWQPAPTSLLGNHRAFSMDLLFRPTDRVRAEFGLEESAGDGLETQLLPRFRLAADVSSIAGAAWETEALWFASRYSSELYFESRPDEESYSATAQRMALGTRWNWKAASFEWPWDLELYVTEFGDVSPPRDIGLNFRSEPAWKALAWLRVGLVGLYRNSWSDVSSLAPGVWVRDANAEVLELGIFARGTW